MMFLGKYLKNGKRPFIVAEISGNHNGDIERAFKLISAAKESGADAVKIQCYDADSLTLKNGYRIDGNNPWNDKELYELYQKNCTPFDWIPKLFDYAKSINVPIFSSVYDERGLEILEKVGCPAYKIASFEANDYVFIEKVAKTGKPIIISTGSLTEKEINRAIVYASIKEDYLVLLHCVSKYPTKIEELNLKSMVDLANTYVVPVGFSCHCNEPIALALAALQESAMIEIHLSIGDEYDINSDDKDFSFTPWQLQNAISLMDSSLAAVSNIKSKLLPKQFHRSLYVVKDIAKDEEFTDEHIKSYRPYLGCDPYLLPQIIGRKASKTIRANTPMKMEYVK